MNNPYKHTQIGYLMLITLGGALLFIIYLMITQGFNWVGFGVTVVLAVCLVLFATLTVEVNQDSLTIQFGPGPIRKQFRLADIAAYQVVKNPWYYGWGIRLIPSGWLYNISGFMAVELVMKDGKKYRIGTDDPEGLLNAIREKQS